ncbi:uncharacterized protein LOC113500206 [Trichoplusia ni]|uniref:Uncharacterized protein LOC113500206 n=1 Tax=Trichoplusia ni TaxID=7111 RepID=A0A7E5W7W0_TRINI|nr:uncharacterized protein LOC113500206 [Trichoplusia ni]
MVGTVSGSDTASSIMSVEPLRSKVLRKRPRAVKNLGSEPLSSEEDMPLPKVGAIVKRGRGRPPSTGEYVGLAKAKALLALKKGKESFLKAEDEIAESVESARAAMVRMTEVLHEDGKCDTEISTSSILKAVSTSLDVVLKVASKSGNLKGTFQRALRDAVSTISDAVETLGTRTVTEETAALQSKTTKLEVDNARLQEELADMRKELAEIRSQVSSEKIGSPVNASAATANAVVPQEELIRAIMIEVGTMVNARIEGLEERLLPEMRLRPALAADTKRTPATVKANPPLPPSLRSHDLGQPRAKKTDKAAAASAADGEWIVVSRRKKPTNKEKLSREQQLQKVQGAPKIPIARKMRTPNSTAVVLQLQPGAELQGVTYASVLSEVKEKIGGAGLGIRFRKAATGARILQVPGAESGERADVLAEQIRNAIGPGVLKVSRPVKTAELSISGFDDSVTSEEVAAVVAHTGACPVASVKVGNIREHGMSGGSVVVKCPITAASKLVGTDLQVGLVAVRVRLLEPRPHRCFRCLRNGHIAAICTDEVDRSGLCFRCGQAGHQSRNCSESPHCPICAASGKSPAHKLGAKVCIESAPNLKNSKKAQVKKTNAVPQAVADTDRVQAMTI